MANFLTYNESTLCEQFCHGSCYVTNGPCEPVNGVFPGCGARLVSLPTSGAEYTNFAKKLAKIIEEKTALCALHNERAPSEDEVFASIQKAMHE